VTWGGFAVVASEVRSLANEAAQVSATVGAGLARLRDLMRQRLSASLDMNEEDAIEYFEYNVSGAYIGEKTPIWCDDIKG
jgi:methyl-accepting chemotaxis protein